MRRLACVVACCGIALGVLGLGRVWGLDRVAEAFRAAPPAAIVELVLAPREERPAGKERPIHFAADNIEHKTPDELLLTGSVTIQLPDGIRINVRQAQVRVLSGADTGRRILVETLPAGR